MNSESTIYILLSHSGSMFSRAINIYTKDPYTHVSVSLDRDLNELYSFGRLRPYNPVLAGFVREDVVNGTYRRFPNTTCALFSLKVSKEQHDMLVEQLERFKRESNKYGYNFLGVVSAMFNHPLSRQYNYFCSQFVSEVLLNSGIEITSKNPGLTSPMDIMSNKDLEFVFEGYLRDYNSMKYRIAL
ncbi:MAG: hypothetical protein RBT15_00525 [Gudongella sp.]|nr:hypothetical protein [Gudongella sp.]